MLSMTKLYFTALIVFLLIDTIWLTLASDAIYRKGMGHLMADNINFTAAAVFYCFYILFACILVIYPYFNHASSSLFTLFLIGAVFGAASYGTYNFTNLSVLKNYPLNIALIDTLWGACLTGTVCFVTGLIAKKLAY